VAVLNTFEEMMALIEQRRDIALKLDVERLVAPISFRQARSSTRRAGRAGEPGAAAWWGG
jgi:hypothetical protein